MCVCVICIYDYVNLNTDTLRGVRVQLKCRFTNQSLSNIM